MKGDQQKAHGNGRKKRRYTGLAIKAGKERRGEDPHGRENKSGAHRHPERGAAVFFADLIPLHQCDAETYIAEHDSKAGERERHAREPVFGRCQQTSQRDCDNGSRRLSRDLGQGVPLEAREEPRSDRLDGELGGHESVLTVVACLRQVHGPRVRFEARSASQMTRYARRPDSSAHEEVQAEAPVTSVRRRRSAEPGTPLH